MIDFKQILGEDYPDPKNARLFKPNEEFKSIIKKTGLSRPQIERILKGGGNFVTVLHLLKSYGFFIKVIKND